MNKITLIRTEGGWEAYGDDNKTFIGQGKTIDDTLQSLVQLIRMFSILTK